MPRSCERAWSIQILRRSQFTCGQRAPDTVRIGIETGPSSTWLWTELKRLGLPMICIDGRHAKAVLQMQINKSDRKGQQIPKISEIYELLKEAGVKAIKSENWKT